MVLSDGRSQFNSAHRTRKRADQNLAHEKLVGMRVALAVAFCRSLGLTLTVPEAAILILRKS